MNGVFMFLLYCSFKEHSFPSFFEVMKERKNLILNGLPEQPRKILQQNMATLNCSAMVGVYQRVSTRLVVCRRSWFRHVECSTAVGQRTSSLTKISSTERSSHEIHRFPFRAHSYTDGAIGRWRFERQREGRCITHVCPCCWKPSTGFTADNNGPL